VLVLVVGVAIMALMEVLQAAVLALALARVLLAMGALPLRHPRSPPQAAPRWCLLQAVPGHCHQRRRRRWHCR
jgi:hypothetical protein